MSFNPGCRVSISDDVLLLRRSSSPSQPRTVIVFGLSVRTLNLPSTFQHARAARLPLPGAGHT